MAFLLVASITACSGGGDGGPKARPTPDPGSAFQIEAVLGVDAKDRPEAATRAQEEAAKIKATVDSFYDIAFVKKSRWGGGQHPDLAGLFVADAQPTVAPNLTALALADSAPQISKMTIKQQKISKTTVLVEDDLSTAAAVATTSFVGTATLAKKGSQPVDVTHSMTMWLLSEGGTWKIYAYSASLKADSRQKTAAFGVPREAP